MEQEKRTKMKTELYDYQKKIRDEILSSGDYARALFMRMRKWKNSYFTFHF